MSASPDTQYAIRNTPDVRWFAWWEVQPALAFGRTGGIALHYFRYDLRRFGLGRADPACHILSADREALVRFAARFGLWEARIQAPRPHRPEVWHFDAFGRSLEMLVTTYPVPPEVEMGAGGSPPDGSRPDDGV